MKLTWPLQHCLALPRWHVKKTAMLFKISVVLGPWHKNAKVAAIKQQKSN
jgi:hypothetical protein